MARGAAASFAVGILAAMEVTGGWQAMGVDLLAPVEIHKEQGGHKYG